MLSVARGAVCNLARSAAARRGLATTKALRSVPEPVHPGYKTIRVKQEKFGVDNGVPVYVKGGAMDSILYGFTMACCIGAVGWDFVFYYELAQK